MLSSPFHTLNITTNGLDVADVLGAVCTEELANAYSPKPFVRGDIWLQDAFPDKTSATPEHVSMVSRLFSEFTPTHCAFTKFLDKKLTK